MLAATAIALAVARMSLSFLDNLRMLRRAREDALTDALTGLPNRRAFIEALDHALEGEVEPRLLALFDLDGFKRYNDAYGHPAGDALLTRLSGALGDVVDGHGRAFRLGGDEFCLLLDDGTADTLLVDAAARARGTRRRLRRHRLLRRRPLPADADTPEEALHLADRRMYAAKEARPSSPGSRRAPSCSRCSPSASPTCASTPAT